MIDSSRSVVKLVLQGSRDGCSADGLGGSQGGLLGVKDWRLSRHYATRGCAGGGGGVRCGWRGAILTEGSELTLSVCWEAKGQGRGLKVPATTFPPARHILKQEREILEISKTTSAYRVPLPKYKMGTLPQYFYLRRQCLQ